MAWRRRQNLRIAALASVLSSGVNAAQLGQTLEYGGGQFITYEGTLGGSFTPAVPRLSWCGTTLYFPPLPNATVRIGVNPSWDANPFYFELTRPGISWQDYPVTTLGTDTSTKAPSISTPPAITKSTSSSPTTTQGGSRSNPVSPTTVSISMRSPQLAELAGPQIARLEPRQLDCVSSSAGDCTEDPIFNLDFQSSYYICMSDGRSCGNSPTSQSSWVAAQMLDLKKAKTAVVSAQIGSDDAGPYYSITGDSGTLVSSGTVTNMFDSQTPGNYSIISSCSRELWPRVIWNTTTPFTYTLNFTNNTALATLTISTSALGSYILSFEGKRVDSNDGDHDPVLHEDPNANSVRYAAISLAAPTDHRDGPHWAFANGTEFYFNGTRAYANLTPSGNGSTSGSGSGNKSSLAPGKGMGGGSVGGAAGAWLGGIFFALTWAVLLC